MLDGSGELPLVTSSYPCPLVAAVDSRTPKAMEDGRRLKKQTFDPLRSPPGRGHRQRETPNGHSLNQAKATLNQVDSFSESSAVFVFSSLPSM